LRILLSFRPEGEIPKERGLLLRFFDKPAWFFPTIQVEKQLIGFSQPT